MSPDEADGSSHGLPPAVVDDLLADSRRCLMLAELGAADGALPVADLAAAVLAREREVSRDSIDAADRRRVERAILGTHLPKLTATGVVAYDSMLATVELLEPTLLADIDAGLDAAGG